MLGKVSCQLAPQWQSHSLLLCQLVINIDAEQLLFGQLSIGSVLVLAALQVRIASMGLRARHTAHVIVVQVLLGIEALPVNEAPVWPLLSRCSHLLFTCEIQVSRNKNGEILILSKFNN